MKNSHKVLFRTRSLGILIGIVLVIVLIISIVHTHSSLDFIEERNINGKGYKLFGLESADSSYKPISRNIDQTSVSEVMDITISIINNVDELVKATLNEAKPNKLWGAEFSPLRHPQDELTAFKVLRKEYAFFGDSRVSMEVVLDAEDAAGDWLEFTSIGTGKGLLLLDLIFSELVDSFSRIFMKEPEILRDWVDAEEPAFWEDHGWTRANTYTWNSNALGVRMRVYHHSYWGGVVELFVDKHGQV